MITSLFRRLRGADSEAGVALAMVVGIGTVLIALVTVCLSFSVSGMVRSSNDQQWNAAMSAAYAGIADYQGRLTNDPSYQQFGNPASTFTIANGSKTSVVLPTGTQANPAFNVTGGSTWAPILDATGKATSGSFRYEVDNSKYATTGVIHLRATGKVGKVTRSVVANVKQTGFTNYVYFTDYELLDPAVNTTKCTQIYAWQSTTAKAAGCTINFVAGDSLDGQVHSNDTLNICGGTFKQKVSTSNPKRDASGKLYTQNNCSPTGTPNFGAGDPVNSALITMPPPQQQLDQVRSDIPGKVPSPGCLYTGPTKITYYVSGTQAYMNVISPWTRSVQVVGNPPTAAGVQPTFCGTPGDPTKSQGSQTTNTLAAAGGQNIAIDPSTKLYNNLVYVQGVPTATTDPNYWATTASPYKNTYSCTGADGKAAGNGLGFPITNEVVSTTASYDCRSGDAFVQGTMHSAMTINADHFVFVTGKLSYYDSANDILGLVGAGSVWVWNPIQCTAFDSNKKCTASKNYVTFEATSSSGNCVRTINAAILSNYHSFEVQNYDQGSYEGKLCVTGSIAQEFRGPVGTGSASTGFTKLYSYDTRLLNSPPPKFPTPRTTSYDVTTEIEVATAFSITGKQVG